MSGSNARLQGRRSQTAEEEPTRKPFSWTSLYRSQTIATPASTREPRGQSSAPSTIHQRRKGLIVDRDIHCQDYVQCVAFLTDGEHIVSGDDGGKIWHWPVDDSDGSGPAGAPMDAGSPVCSIAVSRDGKWIVSGTGSGEVQLWDSQTRDKIRELRGHHSEVYAVDVSADATKIVSGSNDETACVWSLSTGKRLLQPWKHRNYVVAAKFSPDGRLVATATWTCQSVRVYAVEDGRRISDVAIRVGSSQNNSLAWSTDGKQLFVLSDDGNIVSLDAATGNTISKWAVQLPGSSVHRCIALASNGNFIVVSARSSLSFWDTTKHQQIGSVVQLDHEVHDLATSAHHGLAITADQAVLLRNLANLLPSPYSARVDTPDVTKGPIQRSPTQEENAGVDSAFQEKIIEQLRGELADARRGAEEQNGAFHDEIMQLKQTNEKLYNDLTALSSQISKNQENAKIRYQARSNVQYGAACALLVDTNNEEHIRRRDSWEIDSTGDWYVPGYFESKVRVGDGPPEKEFRDHFSLIRNDPADFGEQIMRIMCYFGTLSDPKWLDEDEASFSVLCTIHVDLSEVVKDLVIPSDDSRLYQLDYDVIMSFGRTDIRAEVSWMSGTGERRAPARITLEED